MAHEEEGECASSTAGEAREGAREGDDIIDDGDGDREGIVDVADRAGRSGQELRLLSRPPTRKRGDNDRSAEGLVLSTSTPPPPTPSYSPSGSSQLGSNFMVGRVPPPTLPCS